jgi:hypothetical protein
VVEAAASTRGAAPLAAATVALGVARGTGEAGSSGAVSSSKVRTERAARWAFFLDATLSELLQLLEVESDGGGEVREVQARAAMSSVSVPECAGMLLLERCIL